VDIPDLHVVGDLSGISVEIALTPVGDDDEPIEGARVKLSGALVKAASGAQIVTEPAPVARGRYRTTVFADTSKRRIAVTEVAKTPAQRVVGYLQQRRRG
jgi:hypothetical protein